MGSTLIYFALLTVLTLFLAIRLETWTGDKKHQNKEKAFRFFTFLNVLVGIIIVSSAVVDIASCALKPLMIYMSVFAIIVHGYMFSYRVKDTTLFGILFRFLHGLAGLGGFGYLFINYHHLLGL